MFLTANELAELTGYTRSTKQRAWLDRNGAPYYVAASGRPIVLQSTLGPQAPVADAPPEPAPEPKPDLIARADLDASRVPYRGHPFMGSGIYFLYEAGKLIYIGQSKDMQWRLRAHFMARVDRPDKAMWFDEIAAQEVPERWLDEVEYAYIRRERPPRNIKDNGDK